MELDAMNAAAVYRQVDHSSRVEAASAHGLVAILLGEALDQIDAIDAALTRGRYAHEANARAQGILHALEASLDHRAGGTTAALMGQVYRETRRCLTRATEEIDPFWCKQARLTVEPIVEAWGQIGLRFPSLQGRG
jgi:flagellar secretion chaperone FliS